MLLSEHFSPPGARAAASAQNSGELIGQIQKTLVEYSGKALSIISSWIAKAPAAFTAFLFAVLSSFMISMEYQNISRWIQRNMPPVSYTHLDVYKRQDLDPAEFLKRSGGRPRSPYRR